jgi:hypothetical protein
MTRKYIKIYFAVIYRNVLNHYKWYFVVILLGEEGRQMSGHRENFATSRPVSLKECGLWTWAVYIFVFLAYVLKINSDTRNNHLLFFFLHWRIPTLYDFLACVTDTKRTASGSTVQNATYDESCGNLLVISGWPRRNIEIFLAHIKNVQKPGHYIERNAGQIKQHKHGLNVFYLKWFDASGQAALARFSDARMIPIVSCYMKLPLTGK